MEVFYFPPDDESIGINARTKEKFESIVREIILGIRIHFVNYRSHIPFDVNVDTSSKELSDKIIADGYGPNTNTSYKFFANCENGRVVGVGVNYTKDEDNNVELIDITNLF